MNMIAIFQQGRLRALIVTVAALLLAPTAARPQGPVIASLDAINTPGNDFAPFYEPSVPPRLWYTTQSVGYTSGDDRQTIMTADILRSGVGEGRPLEGAINAARYAGAVSWRTPRLTFAAAGGAGAADDRTDLYTSVRRRGGWDAPQPWSAMNSSAWDSHPSISGDGTLLFFASSRGGGVGGIDLWYSTYDTYRGDWTAPRNAGAAVNTSGDEISPMIAPDNRTLYFASNSTALRGPGGFDIYRVDIAVTPDGGLTAGFPAVVPEVNSIYDDCFYHAVDSSRAYFATNRKNYGRDLDIYSVTPNPSPPYSSLLRRFIVYDCSRRAPFGAGVDIYETVTGRRAPLARSDDGTGSLVLQLPPGEYSVVPIEPGYSGATVIIDRDGVPDERVDTIWVSPVGTWCDVIQPVPVKFESARWEIQSYYREELDHLAARLGPYMEINRDLTVFIDGHTDVRGEDEYNWRLSASRADEVRSYLLRRLPRLSPERIVATPFGESRPIYDVYGLDEAERSRRNAVNRRIEMRIVRGR